MKIHFILIFIFFSLSLSSQTPISFMSSGGSSPNLSSNAEGVSGFNPWLGAQLLQNFDGTGDFSDNLIISGRLLYELNTNSTKFKLPIMGNLSKIKSDILNNSEKLNDAISNIITGENGLNIGVYPYLIINEYKDDDFYFVAHASLGWKLNGFQVDTVTTNYLNTGRFSLGVEIGYGVLNKAGDRPITLSFSPVLSIFDSTQYMEIFGEERSSLLSWETTTVIPISKSGIGIMLEYVFSNNSDNVFRAGIILSGQSGSDSN